jgi:hypothetical protein
MDSTANTNSNPTVDRLENEAVKGQEKHELESR